MNTVLNSYGQLCGCPEILKKSYKFFCRGLDIRVSQIMDSDTLYPRRLRTTFQFMMKITFRNLENPLIRHITIKHPQIFT